MLKLAISIGTAVGVLFATQVAQAHLLTCEKTVNDVTYLEVEEYPITLTYEFTIINGLPDADSCYSNAFDDALNFSFDPPSACVPGGQSVTDSIEITLDSFEECLEFGKQDGDEFDDRLDNVFIVEFDGSQAMCFASVVCMPPEEEGAATRTPGFYKTHLDALGACIDEGPIDLGTMSISEIEDALGLLWGSPAAFPDDQKRDDYEKAWFLLARHTLVATCNTRLFGTDPDPADLIAQAIDALSGTDCELMHELQGMLDDFNNSGDDEPFPEGFDPGPATPQDAEDMATDPTSPSNLQCE